MASLTLRGLNDRFPEGTSLTIRPRSNYGSSTPPVPGQAPLGSATDTQTVSGDAVTFVNLTDDTAYVVTDSGGTKYLSTGTLKDHGAVVKTDSNGNVPLSKIAVLKETVNPFDDRYGAVGDGVTNDYAAVLQAHTAHIAADKSEFVVPPNKRLLLSPATDSVPLPIPATNDPAKRLTWRFQGGSHMVLSNNFRTLFRPNRTTDYQTWRGLDFIDVAVDANNIAGVTGGDDVIFGPRRAGSQGFSQRNNYRDIRFIRPRAWNVPAGGNGGNTRAIINLLSRHLNTNEGDANWNPNTKSQTSILDIVVEDPKFDGGDYGVAMVGALQSGSTAGARIKNFSGTPTTINFTGKTSGSFVVNEWLFVGTGQWFERHQITAVTDNGDGTGSVTLAATLGFAQPTDDGTGASKGAPIVQGNAVNVWHDRLYVGGGYITLGSGAYGCAVQYIGAGIGGHDLVIDPIDLSGSGDNNVEVDTALGFIARGVHSKDPGNQSFMVRNFNLPQDQGNRVTLTNEQTYELEDCTHEIDAIQPTTGAPGCGIYAGYNFTSGHTPAGSAPVFGTLKLKNFKVTDKSPQWRAIKGGALYCGNDCSITRIEGDIDYTKQAASDAAATTPRPFYISPASNAIVKLHAKAKAFGTATGGQPTFMHLEPYTLSGQTAQHDLNVDIDLEARSSLAGVAVGGTRFFDIGETVTAAANKGTIHGRLGAKALAWSGADTAPKIFRWNGGSQLLIVERMFIDGCDLTKLPTAAFGTVHTFQGGTPVAYQRFITHTRRNILLGTFSNFTGSGQFLGSGSGFQEYDVTVGASPFTFVNETTVDLRLRVTGGTVSAVDFSYNSGTTFQTGKLPTAFDSFILRPGEAIKVTYTVAPSVFAWPLL